MKDTFLKTKPLLTELNSLIFEIYVIILVLLVSTTNFILRFLERLWVWDQYNLIYLVPIYSTLLFLIFQIPNIYNSY